MLGHLRLAIAQQSRFSSFTGPCSACLRDLSIQESPFESVRKFQQIGQLVASLVLRLELSNLLVPLGLRSASPALCCTSLSIGSLSTSDACDGFSSQNSSRGEVSLIAASSICAEARSSSLSGVLVNLSSDPEQKLSIVLDCWLIAKSSFEVKAMPLQTAQG